MTTSEQARFTVIFDGAAVKDGAMEVRELAPALLALGNLCERANALLNPDSVQASVRIVARMEAGSFDIHCLFVQSIIEQVKGLFDKEKIHDANELLKLLGISGGIGLIGLLKNLKGKNVKELAPAADKSVTVTINNSTVMFPQEVIILARDPQVREDAEQFVAPLRRTGIEEVRFVKDETVVESISKADVDAFVTPRDLRAPIQEANTGGIHTFTMELITPQFDQRLKWRLGTRGLRVTAVMKDEHFLDRIERRNVQFGKGDSMTVRMKMTQTTNANGKLAAENEIIEVLAYRQVPLQMKLGDARDCESAEQDHPNETSG